MSTHAIDTLTRHAAAHLSRRASLLTLGGIALATSGAARDVADAKKKSNKNNNNNKDKCKKKEQQRCNNDAEECQDTILILAEGDAETIALLTPCCETCSANGFLECLIAASAAASAAARLAPV